jgi:hypothetical protein
MPPRAFGVRRSRAVPARRYAMRNRDHPDSDFKPGLARHQGSPCGAAPPATRIPAGQGVPESRQSPKPLLDLEDLRINDRRGRHPPCTHRTSEPCACPFDRLVRRTPLKDTLSGYELTTHGAPPGPWVGRFYLLRWKTPGSSRGARRRSVLGHIAASAGVFLGRDWQRLPWACIGDISDAITRVACALKHSQGPSIPVVAIVQ